MKGSSSLVFPILTGARGATTNPCLSLKYLKVLSGLTISFFIFAHPGVAGEDFLVGDFKSADLTGWKEKVFKGETQYTFVESDVGTVLQADSRATASGLFREMDIDLEKTPCLTWSWKVDHALEGLNEKTKKGDDYAARIYVVFSEGFFFWQTRALNYVWSGNQPTGSHWPNAFTNKSINIALQSGSANAGQWVRQSRNIRDDYQRFVGKDIKQAAAIALMTDTDNSGGSARAFYGDIRLSQNCQ